jgi:4-hydroxymandelate oxidase
MPKWAGKALRHTRKNAVDCSRPFSEELPMTNRTSRRHFFKMLAGSPLLAAMYPGLPPIWQQGVEREWLRGAGQTQTDPNIHLQRQLEGQLIEAVDEAVNVWDFEQVAHANNLPEHWAYLHMGVDDFETRRANREGFLRLQLRPRRLGVDAPRLDTSVTLFGRKWDTPLFLCPVAALEAYHTEGESGAARAAKARGILQIQSNQSSQGYEEIMEARGEPQWFQLYATPDWNANKRVLDRVAKAGCPVLVWTVDLLGGSNRELQRRTLGRQEYDRPLCQNCHNHKAGYQRPMRRGADGPAGQRYPYDLSYIKRLKDVAPWKVVLKGIVTGEEADLAIQNGADGIFVSNHGGRAENSMRATIDSLPEVVAAVKGRVPVLIDSGVRRGADVFKAIALGADAVGIGRPYVWGLGAFGQQGVDKVIELVLDEFRMVMRQTRTAKLDDISPQFVMEGKTPIMMRHNSLGFGL